MVCTFIVARMVLEHFLFLTPKHTILKKHYRTLTTYIFVNSQWIFCFNDSFCRARDQLSKMVQNFIVALMVPEKEQFFIEPAYQDVILLRIKSAPKNIQIFKIIKVFWFTWIFDFFPFESIYYRGKFWYTYAPLKKNGICRTLLTHSFVDSWYIVNIKMSFYWG